MNRKRKHWSPYVANLVRNIQKAMRRNMTTRKLRFLLYPSGLAPDDQARIRKADAGVEWLGKEAAPPGQRKSQTQY